MTIARTTRGAIKGSAQRRLRFVMDAGQTRWTETDIDEAINSALRSLYPLGNDRRIVVSVNASGMSLGSYVVNSVRQVSILDNSNPFRQETLRPARWSFYPNEEVWLQLEDGIKPGTIGSFNMAVRIVERYSEQGESISADPEAVMLYVLAWLCGQELADGQDSDREMYGRMATEYRVAADLRRQALILMQYPELRPAEKKSK